MAFATQQRCAADGARWDHLINATARIAQCCAQRQHFFVGRERPRYRITANRAMAANPRGGKSERASLDGFGDDARHRAQIVARCRFITPATFAHYSVAYWPVRDHRANIQCIATSGEKVQILRVTAPCAPGHTFVEHRAGYVLDTFHQLDQFALATRCHRCKANTAIAHDHGADTVAGRRVHRFVPSGLAVVVGVDVDPGGGDDGAIGVDGLASGAADLCADFGDAAIAQRQITGIGCSAGTVDDGGGFN